MGGGPALARDCAIIQGARVRVAMRPMSVKE